MGTKIDKLYLCTLLHWILFSGAVLCTFGQHAAMAQTKVYFAEATKDVQAVVVDDLPLAHTNQFIALAKEGLLSSKGDLKKQVDQIFAQLDASLKAAQSGIDQVVKMNVCLKDAGMRKQTEKEIDRRFRKKKPAIAFVTGDLRHPDALIGIDAVAISAYDSKKVNYSHSGELARPTPAQTAILPAGGAVYISGQAAKGNLAEATAKTLKQLEETLHHLGLKKEDVVQIKSFVSPASEIPVAEKEIAAFFAGSTIPPLVFIEWLSKDPVVEIELIAASPKAVSKPQLEFITPPGMNPSPVYAKACRINYGKKIYLSGLYGKAENSPATEAKQVFDSLSRIMISVNSDLNHLVKATYYVAGDRPSKELNIIRPDYYNPERPPAASKALVKGAGKTGASITMDMIGVVPTTVNK